MSNFLEKEKELKKFIKERMKYISKTGKWKCLKCNKILSTGLGIERHIAVKHTKDKHKIYQCTQCDKKYAMRQRWKKHIDWHDNRFQCNYCSRVFTVKSSLDKHVEKQHENSERPFSCLVCRKRFKTRSQYSNHACLRFNK